MPTTNWKLKSKHPSRQIRPALKPRVIREGHTEAELSEYLSQVKQLSKMKDVKKLPTENTDSTDSTGV